MSDNLLYEIKIDTYNRYNDIDNNKKNCVKTLKGQVNNSGVDTMLR